MGEPTSEPPLKVLEVYSQVYTHIKGGLQTMLHTLVDELGQKHRITFFEAAHWQHTTLEQRVEKGYTHYRKRLRSPLDRNNPVMGFIGWLREFPKSLWQLRQLCRQEQIEIIHLHTLQEHHAYFRMLSILGGPPYVITLHGSDVAKFDRQKGLVRWLLQWSLKGASAVVSVSQTLHNDAQQVFAADLPLTWIANGIDTTPPNRAPITPPFSDTSQPYCILAGHLDPNKGQDLAIQAWLRLRQRQPDLHLLLIGSLEPQPQYEKEVRALLEKELSPGRIHLLGGLCRDETLALAASPNCVGWLMPSLREGLPYALLECGVLGKPLLCSGVEPFTDLVQEGTEAVMLPPRDAQAWAEAVCELLEKPGEAQARAQALNRRVIKSYSATGMANAYADLFNKLLNR
ncbi:glycosyltransferase family 4 protein [Magnetococcus sp. PR-3]|uniref:glycosyltransferase family 4 protein n=1 Tax=Magnetococcus sp. PR-3 TaxID=3120355 RepID=UPI002FCE2862